MRVLRSLYSPVTSFEIPCPQEDGSVQETSVLLPEAVVGAGAATEEADDEEVGAAVDEAEAGRVEVTKPAVEVGELMMPAASSSSPTLARASTMSRLSFVDDAVAEADELVDELEALLLASFLRHLDWSSESSMYQ